MARCCGRRSCYLPPRARRTQRSRAASTVRCGRCLCGGSVSSRSGSTVSAIDRDADVRAVFPPEQIAEVKAIACSLPREHGLPLSRFSRAELHRLVIQRGVCAASAATIARWLREDALKPWQHRSWIFPTDPAFLEKAGPVLDLYQGRWQGKLLHPGEFVICADEKPSIQARKRIHETLPPAPHTRGQRVEHTYQRQGALTYLAALDIGRRGGRRPRVFGRSEPRGGIEPFDQLVRQVMTKQPYASARRVFWIVDNGSSHRGRKSVKRLEQRWPNLVLVHLPVHASWLNQIEIYFSIVQRKVLEPNNFQNVADVAHTLNAFEHRWNEVAEPFEWKFTGDDLARLIERLTPHKPQLKLAA